MATISVSAYNDDAARTAGEAIIINTGATWTVRTDTRVHATAPTLGTGSLGSITVTEGEIVIDARNIRWMAYTGGSGTVPAIGTIVSQGGTSGYLLGVWSSLTSLAAVVGQAMPATGYLKFREVTGSFVAGALTGITATASSPDVVGWMEFVCDQAATISVPRSGKFTTRGDYFYLDTTTGVRGQQLQVPTNGGGATTYAAGVEIETAPGSGEYDLYPALRTATNGWAVNHLGQAKDESDTRQQFVSMLDGGILQIGERITQTGTYAYTASQTTTYASSTRAGYYWRINNRVEVYCATGHYMLDGWQTGFDATSGTASDGVVTVTVHNPYWFSFDQVGADTEGTCNSRESVACTFTAHGLNMYEKVRLTPTTGTLPAGEYEIIGIPGANVYWIRYPHTAALTSGSTGALHTITVTTSAVHGLAIGHRVSLDFTTGTGIDGVYTVRTVPTTTTYTINCPLTATTSGNFTSTHDIGYVPPAGCKTRIPNIIMRQCVTTTRATNAIAHATIATRPEFATTSAGKIDMEYVTSDWYFNLAQAYEVLLKNCHAMDTLQLSEIATPFVLDNCLVGMVQALDIKSLQCTSNFAGGQIIGGVYARGNLPGASDHSVEIIYCSNISIQGGRYGIQQYARSSGIPLQISYSTNIDIEDTKIYNGQLTLTSCSDVSIKNLGYCDRYIGYTSNAAAMYCVLVDIMSNNILVDGITFGHNNSIINCHPANSVVRIAGRSYNTTFRNLGTLANPLPASTWQPNLNSTASLIFTGGNCYDYRGQNCYITQTRGDLLSTINSDKDVVFENIHRKEDYILGTMAINAPGISNLNAFCKNMGMLNAVSSNASVYGTHFAHHTTNDFGRLVLMMHEPTPETSAYFTNVTGSAKFNSNGGCLMNVVGSQNIWESFEIRGVTGFEDYEGPVLSGSTQTWYLIEYALDTGSGYGDWHNYSRVKAVASGVSATYNIVIADPSGLEVGDYIFGGSNLGYRNRITAINGTTITMSKPNRGAASGTVYFSHLPFETVPASGFKIKVRVTTTTTATTAISHIRFTTKASIADMLNNLYPLDTITLTLNGLVSGSDIVVLQAGTETVLATAEDVGSTQYGYTYETPTTVDIRIYKPGYFPASVVNYVLGSTNASLPIVQVPDVSYLD